MSRSTNIATVALPSFAVGALLAIALLLGSGWRPFGAAIGPAATAKVAGIGSLPMVSDRRASFSFADAVSRAAPAVVNVYGSHAPPQPRIGASGPSPAMARDSLDGERRHGRTSLGSGVLVSRDGLLLTNRHIIEGADAIDVELADGRLLDVELLGVDAETDLAVLRATGPALPAIAIGDPAALRVGDVVLAIGNPFGIGQTVSLGIVSATGRRDLGLTDVEHFIQTDAAINPGNSGGPLIDAAGRLVGINTAILSDSGLSEGVGFAVPADIAMHVAREIADNGAVERGWLGVSGLALTPWLAERFGLRAPHGVLITGVREHSPAALAGLRTGDVLTNAAGRTLSSANDLRQALDHAGPAAKVRLDLWRGSEKQSAFVTTVKRPRVLDSADGARQANALPFDCGVFTAGQPNDC